LKENSEEGKITLDRKACIELYCRGDAPQCLCVCEVLCHCSELTLFSTL